MQFAVGLPGAERRLDMQALLCAGTPVPVPFERPFRLPRLEQLLHHVHTHTATCSGSRSINANVSHKKDPNTCGGNLQNGRRIRMAWIYIYMLDGAGMKVSSYDQPGQCAGTPRPAPPTTRARSQPLLRLPLPPPHPRRWGVRGRGSLQEHTSLFELSLCLSEPVLAK